MDDLFFHYWHGFFFFLLQLYGKLSIFSQSGSFPMTSAHNFLCILATDKSRAYLVFQQAILFYVSTLTLCYISIYFAVFMHKMHRSMVF